MTSERIPPSSPDLEAAVLSAILQSEQAAAALSADLDPGAFYLDPHRTIFTAACRCVRRGLAVDVRTVAEELNRQGKLADIGGVLLDRLVDSPPSPNWLHHARIIREKAECRAIIQAGERIAAAGYTNESTLEEYRNQAEATLFTALQTRQEGELLDGKALAASLDREEQTDGLETGLTLLDSPEPVLAPGRLVVLAGRTNIGKTALACAILTRHALAMPPVPCLFLSCEQNGTEITKRLIVQHSGWTADQINKNAPPVKSVERVAESGMWLDPAGAPTLTHILGRIRAARATHGIRLVVVDHIGKITGGRKESRTLEVGDVARGLKAIAKDLQIPVLALAQLNRAVESRNSKRPMLADLRESGEIEQEADAVVFLWTPEENPHRLVEVPMFVTLAKNRHGSPGEVKATFNRPTLRLEAAREGSS